MRTRLGLSLHLVALAVAALAAWWAFVPAGDGPGSGLVFVDLSSADLKGIQFLRDERQVRIETLADGSGHMISVEEKAQPNQKASSDGGTPDGQAPDGDGEAAAEPDAPQPARAPIQSRYRASAEFGKALERILPLVAIRELGQVAPDALARYGLDEPEARLILTSAEEEVIFAVGKKTYGGSSFYLRRLPDGPVALVSAGLLRALDFKAPRYREMRFLDATAKDLERIDVSCSGLGKRSLLRKPGRKPGTIIWVPEDEPTRDDLLFGNWVGKLLRLAVVEYLPADAKPGAPARCQVALHPASGKQPRQAVLGWLDGPDDKTSYAGRSDLSTTWVVLEPSSAAAVQADLSAVLGAESAVKP